MTLTNSSYWPGDQDTAGNRWPWRIVPSPWVPTSNPWIPWTPPYQPYTPSPIPMPKQRAPTRRKPVKSRAQVRRLTRNKETYITLILDKSTSMSTCYDAALNAINEQISVIRKNAKKGGATFVSLLLFGDTIDVVFENVPAAQVKPLEKADYRLEGCTALRDAVMTAIDLMVEKQCAEKNQGFLSVLISDGCENASGTTKEQLKGRIDELNKTDKWTFSYMLDGHSWEAMQDLAWTSGASLSNVACYSSTPTGTGAAGKAMAQSVGNYLTVRSAGVQSSQNFYSDKDDQTLDVTEKK